MQINCKIKCDMRERMSAAAKEDGMDLSGWMRAAFKEKLQHGKEQEALIKSVQNLDRSIRGIRATERMIFSAVIALAKLIIICLREPTGDVLVAARAVAPQREEAFKRWIMDEYGDTNSEVSNPQ
jgi:hypothetical protein